MTTKLRCPGSSILFYNNLPYIEAEIISTCYLTFLNKFFRQPLSHHFLKSKYYYLYNFDPHGPWVICLRYWPCFCRVGSPLQGNTTGNYRNRFLEIPIFSHERAIRELAASLNFISNYRLKWSSFS